MKQVEFVSARLFDAHQLFMLLVVVAAHLFLLLPDVLHIAAALLGFEQAVGGNHVLCGVFQPNDNAAIFGCYLQCRMQKNEQNYEKFFTFVHG